MVRRCALLLSFVVLGALATALRRAPDAVDDFKSLVKSSDVKADAIAKAFQPLIAAGTAAALPPLAEGLDHFEEQLESSSVTAARSGDGGAGEKGAKTSAESARAKENLDAVRKGSLELADAIGKKGDAAGLNLLVQAYERHTLRVDEQLRRAEEARGKLADLSTKLFELEQKKAPSDQITKTAQDKAEQAVRVELIGQVLDHRRELRIKLANATGALLQTAKGPDVDRTVATIEKKVESKAPPEDRIRWIALYARLGRETIPAEVLDAAQAAARQWKVHEDEANKLREKYEKATEAMFRSTDKEGRVSQATILAYKTLEKQMQAATAGQRDMDRLRLEAGRSVGAAVAAVAEAKRDKLVDWALGAAQNEKEIDTRCAVVESLGQLDHPKVREALRKWLVSEKDVRVRLEALEALVQLKDLESLDVVRSRLLVHDNWRVRAAAVSALVRLPQKESVPALITALEGEVGRMREDVTQALQSLTGQSFAMSAPVWKQWWDKEGAAFKIEDVAKRRKAVVAAADAAEGGKVTYYGITSTSKHICFVIDISLSMNEPASDTGSKSKLDVSKEELKHAIDSLSDGDTFTVIAFAGSVEKWQPKMTKVTAAVKERARKWIDNDLNLDKGTNIYAGMRAAFEIAGLGSKDTGYTSEIDTIFFMTDGQPTVGEVQDPLELRRLIREWNRLSRIRIHCIGVGKDLNIPLLYGIAEDAGGQFQHR